MDIKWIREHYGMESATLNTSDNEEVVVRKLKNIRSLIITDSNGDWAMITLDKEERAWVAKALTEE